MRLRIATMLSLLALGAAACGDDGDDRADATGDTAPGREMPAERENSTAVNAAERAGVDVKGQETLIELSSGFRDALEREGIRVEVSAPARMAGDTITLPIDGGRVSVDDGGGAVDHSGTIAFRGESDSVEVSDVFVDTRSGTVYGIVGGTRVRVFTLDTSRLDVQKGDDHVVAGDLDVMVAGDGAAVLEEELDASVEAGQQVGTMKVRLVPRLPAAAGAPETLEEAEQAGADTLAELRSLEERARALAEQAADDLPAEDRERLEEAARSLTEAIEGS